MSDEQRKFDPNFDGQEHTVLTRCYCQPELCKYCEKGMMHYFSGYGYYFYQCDVCNKIE